MEEAVKSRHGYKGLMVRRSGRKSKIDAIGFGRTQAKVLKNGLKSKDFERRGVHRNG